MLSSPKTVGIIKALNVVILRRIKAADPKAVFHLFSSPYCSVPTLTGRWGEELRSAECSTDNTLHH